MFFSSVQSLSHVWLFVTPWTATRQASLSFTNSQTLLKLMSIESVMPFSHLTLCRPLLLLPSNFPRVTVFSNESALCIRWPKYQSFSFNISPSNKHPGLISFRTDWLDLLAVQRTLKSLLQHHSSKASMLLHSAFFIVQFSHPYMTTGKTIALTRRTLVQRKLSTHESCYPHSYCYTITIFMAKRKGRNKWTSRSKEMPRRTLRLFHYLKLTRNSPSLTTVDSHINPHSRPRMLAHFNFFSPPSPSLLNRHILF